MKTVLYFGNIDLEVSRNKIYVDGLRKNGVEVLLCVDRSRGIRKYWNLYKKHKELLGKYDALIVGYGGYVTVPMAKLISNKPVIFDALCSFYETEILSRDALKEIPFRILYVRFIDWLSTYFADKILVESNKQKEYFSEKLKVKSEKLLTVYTGVDDSIFKFDESIEKYEKFTVLFRGRIMSEAGVPTIIKTAKFLENKNIDFLIIGHGYNDAMREFEKVLKEENPKNVTYVGKQLPFDELVILMQKCHVSLGQFAKHERLERTIPHKAYESLALKLPYITARTGGVQEVLQEDVHCLMVNPEDPEDLAQKIKLICKDGSLREKLSDAGYLLYKERFSPKEVVSSIVFSSSLQ
ncbi:MAG: Glycosyl transferase group 1 [Parcubacteria group bacterium GW2011_GWD2_42_14]|nr:MAG: Glycosyl transferase group 1 [Parcubacteria group bacterium GW2011_GWD2_42_14]